MARSRQRPYEQAQITKRSVILFAVGVAAMLVTVAVVVAITVPAINRRLENLPYYAQTYYHKLMPHPAYLPTPVVAITAIPAITATRPPLRNAAMPAAASLTITPTATASSTPLPSPTATTPPLPAKTQLTGITHQWQTWNNCGPATVTMAMSYFGRPETQADAAKFLKPNKDDKNVSPAELAAYARTVGLEAVVRQGGSVTLLKQFLSSGLPVIAETWFIHDNEGMGHYRLLTGYADDAGQFFSDDSFNGPNVTLDYARFEADWRVFNRLYVVIYPPEQANLVAALIGPDTADDYLYNRLAQAAQAEIEADPADAIAHFNQGDAYTRLGRYPQAVAAFDQARTLGLHWRRLWYQFTPFEAYYAVGRYQDVLDLAQATIAGAGGLEEAYYYQGLALQATHQPGTQQAFQAALAYNANFAPAREALAKLTP